MSPLIGFAAIWLLFGVWAYGRSLGYWQHKYPSLRGSDDVWTSLFMAAMGPIGLMAMWPTVQGWPIQFRPKASETEPPIEIDPDRREQRQRCPACGYMNIAMPNERAADRVGCVGCGNHFRHSTGELIQADFGGDEPDWSEPSASDLEWARATMPGKASGHIIAWRRWRLHDNLPETPIDRLSTRDLASLSQQALCEKMLEIQQAVQSVRDRHPYLLQSGNGFEWQPGEPVVGWFHDNMPRAHGAGVYALRECSRMPVEDREVIGRVALWGNVMEHEHGYRARYAYPVELWHPIPEVADALGQAYGVTVHTGLPEGCFPEGRFEQRQRDMMNQMARAMSVHQIHRQSPGLQQQRIQNSNWPTPGQVFGGAFYGNP